MMQTATISWIVLKVFVDKGISEGRRDDLTGGGLIRNHGGWAAVKHMRRAKMFEKSDERILGGVNH
jgi:hypothetical protein